MQPAYKINASLASIGLRVALVSVGALGGTPIIEKLFVEILKKVPLLACTIIRAVVVFRLGVQMAACPLLSVFVTRV